jgi:hypothetical protein
MDIFASLALTSFFVISHTTFAKYCENIRYLHNSIYSLAITYSAGVDLYSYIWRPNIHIGTIEYVLLSYILYNILFHWSEMARYEKIGLIINMGINYYFRTDLLVCISYNYLQYGHGYVILGFLKYGCENGSLDSFTYKKYMSALYSWIITPYAIFMYSLLLWKMLFDSTIEYDVLGLIFVHVGYFVSESYIAAVDLGYNKALLRISGERAI